MPKLDIPSEIKVQNLQFGAAGASFACVLAIVASPDSSDRLHTALCILVLSLVSSLGHAMNSWLNIVHEITTRETKAIAPIICIVSYLSLILGFALMISHFSPWASAFFLFLVAGYILLWFLWNSWCAKEVVAHRKHNAPQKEGLTKP